LRIWLPAQFHPLAASPAAELLQARLDEFVAQQPLEARLDVRPKALDGPGGLLDSLTTASAAAPLALPDLILLPRPMLEIAALKGLLHPMDGLLTQADDTDWYPYARQMARLQNSVFGLPFAGDALILIYRPQKVLSPPTRLEEALRGEHVLAFAAADPQALFTLALYQATGGSIVDDQGRPSVEKDKLAQVLNFYAQAAKSEITPFWLTQYQSDDQVWEAFRQGQADMAITWSWRYLSLSGGEEIGASLIPTPQGQPFTLATGWVWALAGLTQERQRLSVQLAEFLTAPDFLGRWNAAAGYLPPRPSAVETWAEPDLRLFASRLSESAQLQPSADLLASLATPLTQATVEVLKQQSDADSAAQEVLDSLQRP
jgi:ABC-type glycerol-3-phosphate transport system substrate-binding protein